MGIAVTGIEELRYLLEQTGKKAVEGVINQMKEEGREIRDLARKMAPVDEHNLERAIKVRAVGGGRDSAGRFARKSVEVFVDEDTDVPSKPGRTVGEYAYIMHEHLTPYGHLRLGEKSLQKQGGQPELVGGGYLERAVEEQRRGMIERLVNVARRYL